MPKIRIFSLVSIFLVSQLSFIENVEAAVVPQSSIDDNFLAEKREIWGKSGTLEEFRAERIVENESGKKLFRLPQIMGTIDDREILDSKRALLEKHEFIVSSSGRSYSQQMIHHEKLPEWQFGDNSGFSGEPGSVGVNFVWNKGEYHNDLVPLHYDAVAVDTTKTDSGVAWSTYGIGKVVEDSLAIKTYAFPGSFICVAQNGISDDSNGGDKSSSARSRLATLQTAPWERKHNSGIKFIDYGYGDYADSVFFKPLVRKIQQYADLLGGLGYAQASHTFSSLKDEERFKEGLGSGRYVFDIENGGSLIYGSTTTVGNSMNYKMLSNDGIYDDGNSVVSNKLSVENFLKVFSDHDFLGNNIANIEKKVTECNQEMTAPNKFDSIRSNFMVSYLIPQDAKNSESPTGLREDKKRDKIRFPLSEENYSQSDTSEDIKKMGESVVPGLCHANPLSYRTDQTQHLSYMQANSQVNYPYKNYTCIVDNFYDFRAQNIAISQKEISEVENIDDLGILETFISQNSNIISEIVDHRGDIQENIEWEVANKNEVINFLKNESRTDKIIEVKLQAKDLTKVGKLGEFDTVRDNEEGHYLGYDSSGNQRDKENFLESLQYGEDTTYKDLLAQTSLQLAVHNIEYDSSVIDKNWSDSKIEDKTITVSGASSIESIDGYTDNIRKKGTEFTLDIAMPNVESISIDQVPERGIHEYVTPTICKTKIGNSDKWIHCPLVTAKIYDQRFWGKGTPAVHKNRLQAIQLVEDISETVIKNSDKVTISSITPNSGVGNIDVKRVENTPGQPNYLDWEITGNNSLIPGEYTIIIEAENSIPDGDKALTATVEVVLEVKPLFSDLGLRASGDDSTFSVDVFDSVIAAKVSDETVVGLNFFDNEETPITVEGLKLDAPSGGKGWRVIRDVSVADRNVSFGDFKYTLTANLNSDSVVSEVFKGHLGMFLDISDDSEDFNFEATKGSELVKVLDIFGANEGIVVQPKTGVSDAYKQFFENYVSARLKSAPNVGFLHDLVFDVPDNVCDAIQDLCSSDSADVLNIPFIIDVSHKDMNGNLVEKSVSAFLDVKVSDKAVVDPEVPDTISESVVQAVPVNILVASSAEAVTVVDGQEIFNSLGLYFERPVGNDDGWNLVGSTFIDPGVYSFTVQAISGSDVKIVDVELEVKPLFSDTASQETLSIFVGDTLDTQFIEHYLSEVPSDLPEVNFVLRNAPPGFELQESGKNNILAIVHSAPELAVSGEWEFSVEANFSSPARASSSAEDNISRQILSDSIVLQIVERNVYEPKPPISPPGGGENIYDLPDSRDINDESYVDIGSDRMSDTGANVFVKLLFLVSALILAIGFTLLFIRSRKV